MESLFFYASKIIMFLLNPSAVLSLIIGGYLILSVLFSARPENSFFLTRWLGRASLTIALILVFIPVQTLMRTHLEQKFPIPTPLPEQIAGVIVLGGSVSPTLTHAYDQVNLNDSVERMTQALPILQKYPLVPLIYTGGSGKIIQEQTTEAAVAKRFYREIGWDSFRFHFEDKSRNTYQNAVFSRELINQKFGTDMHHPKDGQKWILITSAVHMPRAMHVFESDGWAVIPYPVDFQRAGEIDWIPHYNFISHATHLGPVLHEYIGILAYWATGRINHSFWDLF